MPRFDEAVLKVLIREVIAKHRKYNWVGENDISYAVAKALNTNYPGSNLGTQVRKLLYEMQDNGEIDIGLFYSGTITYD